MKNTMDMLIVEDNTPQTDVLVETLGVAGLELSLAMKHQRGLQSVPLLMLTSRLAPADVFKALEASADIYLPKLRQGESQVQSIDTIIRDACTCLKEETGTTSTVVINEVAQQISTSLKELAKLLIATYEIAVQKNQALVMECEVKEVLNETLAQQVREQTASLRAEIAKRKQLEEYQQLGLDILQALTAPGDFKATIRHILAELLAWTGLEAGGLRLQEGNDFPYFATQGFNNDFLLKENSLTGLCANGDVCHGKDGKVSLACTCGLVISGRTDPANPLFTQGGSFWTNNAFSLLDLPAAQNIQGNPRNECIRQGFASVALIPIRAKRMIVGLLHLCSHKQDCFSLSTVTQLEGIAAHIGEALTCKLAEEALKTSEKEFCSLAESMPQIVWIAQPDGETIYFNQQWVAYTGLTLAKSYGYGWNTRFHPDDWQRVLDAMGEATKNDTTYALNCRLLRADGIYRWWLVRGVAVRDVDGKISKWFGTCTDIENIKQGESLIASRLAELWHG